jgi:hypothetical protein
MPENCPEYKTVQNGTSPHAAVSHPLRDPLTAYEIYPTLAPIEKLMVIRTHWNDPTRWLDDDVLEVLALYRHTPPGEWGKTKLAYKAIGGFPPDLQEAVDRYLSFQPGEGRGAHAILINGADIQEEDIDWLWDPYIAKKTITILDGDPGVGKTMFACQLAASISRGYPLPDQAGHMTMGTAAPAHVLLVGMEDHLGSVVKKRLDRCQADLSKLTFCNEIVDAAGRPRPFTLADLPLLEAYMEESRPTLVYIDAIQGVLGGKVDIGSPNQIKALLLPLEQLAKDYNCAIVCSRHPSKPGQHVARLIHRGMGSQSFIGSARSGLFIETYPGDSTRSLLVHYKTNSGGLGRTQLFSKDHGVFHWCGVSRIGEAVLAGGGRGPHPEALLEACFWLEDALASGTPRLSREMESEAEAADIALGVLKRAKKALGILSTQVTGEAHGGWLWSLPPLGTHASDATEVTDITDTTEDPDLESKTYEGCTADGEAQRSRASEGSGASEGSEDSVSAVIHREAMVIPCVNCGGTKRWPDHGIWRCRVCWPQGSCSERSDDV